MFVFTCTVNIYRYKAIGANAKQNKKFDNLDNTRASLTNEIYRALIVKSML